MTSHSSLNNTILGVKDSVTATWSWTFTLKNPNGKTSKLNINCPISFVFNVLHILLINKEDYTSTNIFVNSHQSGLTISVNLKMDSLDWKVLGFGLQTVNSITGQYDVAVCCGSTDKHITENDMERNFELQLAAIQEIELPLQFSTQGTLPVSVSRQPPSFYRLDVNHIFSQDIDFIVFVKIKNQLRCYLIQRKRVAKFPFPFEIPSATNVSCKVICACRHQSGTGYSMSLTTISHSRIVSFRSFLSLADTFRLYNLAIEFGSRRVLPNMKPIQYFYRNKSVEYFNVILNNFGGEMIPYLKSNGGEQGSVLNGRLPGLFFSTYLDPNTNMPNTCSFYGPIRLYVQALVMFNPMCNLYFADFYCHYTRHHVTIILTPKLSPCNIFCRQYLPELNIFNNPYLCLNVTPQGLITVMANMDVTTEVFYTESINITRILSYNAGKIEKTAIIGRGFAPSTGIPKNCACIFCNLK